MTKRPFMTALVVIMILSLAGCKWGGQDKKSGAKAPAPTTTASSTTVPSTTTTTIPPPSADTIINQIGDHYPGFKPGELQIGSKHVSFKGAPEERGTAAFSKRTLKTPAQVGAFLNEKTDVSRAAKQRVTDAIRKAGYGGDEVKRAMDGSGYFPIQVKVAARVLGTTYFKDGKVYEMGEWRSVGPNDVFWLFLTKDGRVIFGAAVRADCGNPNIKLVTPIPPGTRPPSSIEQICPHQGDVPDQNGLCPKHPGDDVLNDVNVPKKPKGPGCVPDPRDSTKCLPKGLHPGLATPPVTTPTGCQPACQPPSPPHGVTTTTVFHPTPSTVPTVVTDPVNTVLVTAPGSG